MSNRDGFAGGFIAGAAVGGLVGAVLGVVLSKRGGEALLTDPSEAKARKRSNGKGSQLEDERIEVARLSLEDKIAQLNQAIDDVRLQLGDVNGNVQVHSSQSSLTEDS
jgi:gas vesicle protein